MPLFRFMLQAAASSPWCTPSAFPPCFTAAALLSSCNLLRFRYNMAHPERTYSTFECQTNLPRLPVPSLEHTMSLYLNSVKPLCSGEEYALAKELAGDFQHGVGKVLQAHVLSRAENEHREGRSWLERWWEEHAYLKFKQPLVPQESLLFKPSISSLVLSGNEPIQARTAATYINACLTIVEKLVKQELPPDRMRGKVKCMEQYKRMFGCCRVPRSKLPDFHRITFPQLAKHIVLARRGIFYKLNVVDENFKPMFSVRDLAQEIATLCQKAEDASHCSLGWLACGEREAWGRARELLIQSERNRRNLETIETALFMVTLDSTSQQSVPEETTSEWTSTMLEHVMGGPEGHSRWPDKSLSFIFLSNGTTGLSLEHSAMDGWPSVRLCEEIAALLLQGKTVTSSQMSERPAKLEWEMPPTIHSMILNARNDFPLRVSANLQYRCDFAQFGSDYIKKGLKTSPDAFIQTAFHLAFYRCFGTLAAVYEAVGTTSFYHGRTETCRSLTPAMAKFVHAFDSTTEHASLKYSLYRDVVVSHTSYVAEAASGHGIDRHLLGLQVASQELGLPLHALFTQDVFKRSCDWNLSTSSLAAPVSPLGITFPPVSQTCIGIQYQLYPDAIVFCLNSDKRSPKFCAMKYSKFLKQAILDLAKVVGASSKM